MSDPFSNLFADVFKTPQIGQMPGSAQAFVHDGLSKTRAATLQSIAVVRQGAEKMGQTAVVARKETSDLTAKAFEQATRNIEAAFDAAQAISKAKSPIEAAKLQTEFVQGQLALAGEQSKELFELSTKVAQKTAEDMTAFASMSAANFTKA